MEEDAAVVMVVLAIDDGGGGGGLLTNEMFLDMLRVGVPFEYCRCCVFLLLLLVLLLGILLVAEPASGETILGGDGTPVRESSSYRRMGDSAVIRVCSSLWHESSVDDSVDTAGTMRGTSRELGFVMG